jgi:hypothetical protein
MTTLRLLVSALILAALAACSSETGIVIEVTRDKDTTPNDIDRLRLFVGVETGPNASVVGDFVQDADPDDDVVFLEGRDLYADPYRVLLRQGDAAADMNLVVFVVAFKGQQVVGFGNLAEPVSFLDGKVLQWGVEVKGGRDDRIDITDTGCLIWTTDGDSFVVVSPTDMDCDGDRTVDDCDDNDPNIGPSSPERCFNNIDDDCDETVDEQEDKDLDGVLNCEDCDDTNELMFPGNPEVCDGIDNDCSGACDDGELDFDDDKYTVCDRKIFDDGTCSDPNESLYDCNDDDPLSFPGADEFCDGFDNNCDGSCDENQDPDSDTFTFCGSIVDQCTGEHEGQVDCEPDNENVFPTNDEFCDGQDNNCDGAFYPEDNQCFTMDTMGNFCLLGYRQCEDDGGIGWHDCAPESQDPGNQVPVELCNAYDACEALGEADPFQCALDDVNVTATYACNVLHDDESNICPIAEVSLPNMSPNNCSWSILGGQYQLHYLTYLRALGDVLGNDDQVAVCDAVFGIEDAFDVPPLPDTFFLWQQVNTSTTQFLRIDATPMLVAQCPIEGGLQCTGLLPPVDVNMN